MYIHLVQNFFFLFVFKFFFTSFIKNYCTIDQKQLNSNFNFAYFIISPSYFLLIFVLIISLNFNLDFNLFVITISTINILL